MGINNCARGAAIVAIAAVAAVLLTACSAPGDSDIKSACEDTVQKSVVKHMRDAGRDNPWDVTKVKSTEISPNSQSDDEVKVFDVAGTAQVNTNESGSDHFTATWTCFAQYRTDDKRVLASVNRMNLG